MPVEYIILGILTLWLLAISIVLISFLRFFNKLTKDTKSGNLRKVLEEVLSQQIKNKEEINKIIKEIEGVRIEGLDHIQKVALVRFNPFREIGGDHSFSLAILDGHNTGVVVTGLHTRERTRVYAKPVKNGKSEIELSDEEKKALTKVLKN